MPEFILMLTYNDRTVENALTLCQQVRTLGLRYIGFKDIGLPLEEQKLLVNAIHEGGQEVMLEVVSERKEDELRSATSACELGVDYLLGGTHAPEVTRILTGTSIRYYPFPGQVIGHPSQLRGSIEEIVVSAQELAALDGVHGLDLLAYRYDGDVEKLTRAVVQAVQIPVIAAGSIDSEQRIRSVSEAGVWGFTIGSALFEGAFLDPTIFLPAQITRVLGLIHQG
ncbi:MAG: 4-hydroxythreonine-4-phosphate dehydrogenase [Chloroflexi bacterium]|nr:4-hydroxythreonine-4-phosphate dehydrogenase [Chloroflexota bacterium]